MVGFKRPGIGPAGHALQHGRFDLQEIPGIEPAAHGAHHQGAAAEGFAGVGRHDQIEVALAVALLHIGQAMPLIGQGLEALGEHGPALHLHRQLAAVGAAQGAFHTDQIAGIHQAGEVGKGFGILRNLRFQGGLFNKELDGAGLIGQGEEGQFAHHPAGHHPAGHGHGHIALLAVREIGMGRLELAMAMAGLKAQAIGPLADGR